MEKEHTDRWSLRTGCRIFGLKKEEITGDWSGLCNEKLYRASDIFIRVICGQNMRQKRRAYGVLVVS
jgi:hypothetical protein